MSFLSRARIAELAIVAAIFVGFGMLYLSTLQGRVYGNDGAFLCEWSTAAGRPHAGYHNVLFHRVALAFGSLFPAGVDPLTPVRTLGALSTALGLALCHATCAALGLPRRASLAAVMLLGLSPAMWFFATTVEVHSLHFAIVAATAWILTIAPWQRPALALLVACAVLPWSYLSHQSAPALGFGWVLLAQCGRIRRGKPRFGWLQLAGIGVVMLGALLLGRASGNAVRGAGFGLGLGELGDTVEFWQRSAALAVLRDEIVVPLALLLPFALLGGYVLARTNRWLALASAALFVPAAVFLLHWGIVERGGYVLGPSIGLVFAAAAGWRALAGGQRWREAVLWSTVAVQAWLGFDSVRSFDAAGFAIDQRIALLDRVFGDGPGPHHVVSANYLAPSATIHLPNVTELNLLPSFVGITTRDEWLTQRMPPALLFQLVGQRPFVLDRSYRKLDEHWRGLLRECLEALEAAIERDYAVEAFPHPSWDLWLVRPRG